MSNDNIDVNFTYTVSYCFENFHNNNNGIIQKYLNGQQKINEISPLCLDVENKNIEIVKLLLEKDALNVNYINI